VAGDALEAAAEVDAAVASVTEPREKFKNEAERLEVGSRS